MHTHIPAPSSPQRPPKPTHPTLDTSPESPNARPFCRALSSLPYVLPYKMKHSLCRNHTDQGFCYYGQRCQFAHGVQQLRTPSSIYRNKPCLFFLREGYCMYGQRCHFIHHQKGQEEMDTRQRWRVIYGKFREEGLFASKEGRRGRLMRILGKEKEKM